MCRSVVVALMVILHGVFHGVYVRLPVVTRVICITSGGDGGGGDGSGGEREHTGALSVRKLFWEKADLEERGKDEEEPQSYVRTTWK